MSAAAMGVYVLREVVFEYGTVGAAFEAGGFPPAEDVAVAS